MRMFSPPATNWTSFHSTPASAIAARASVKGGRADFGTLESKGDDVDIVAEQVRGEDLVAECLQACVNATRGEDGAAVSADGAGEVDFHRDSGLGIRGWGFGIRDR